MQESFRTKLFRSTKASVVRICEWFKENERAIAEVACVAIISIAPLVLIEVVTNATNPNFLLGDAAWRSVAKGQLILYSLSLIGTLAWLIVSSNNSERLIARVFIGALVIVCSYFICSLYTLDPSFEKPKNDFIIYSSIACYVLFLFFYLWLLLIGNESPETPEGKMRREAANIARQAEAM